jgi:hypothetical protein
MQEVRDQGEWGRKTRGLLPFSLERLCDAHGVELLTNAQFHGLYDLKGRAPAFALAAVRRELPIELAAVLSRLGGALHELKDEPCGIACRMCEVISSCGCGEGVACALRRYIPRLVQDAVKKADHPSSMCERHWRQLQDGLEAQGLAPYIADTPAEGTLRMIMGRFEPQALALTLITNVAVQRIGLSVLMGGCPVCYLSDTCTCGEGEACGARRSVEHCLEHVQLIAMQSGVVQQA